MANAIKPLISSLSSFTITLASLASSTTGVGRQSTVIDNSSTRYKRIFVSASITLGTSPTAGRTIQLYAILSNKDTTAIRDDLAGASDAAWTRTNADYLYTRGGRPSIFYCGAAASNAVFAGNFIIENPGPEFAIGVVHDTGVNLNSTGGNHVLKWAGENPEIQ
jgi:hypothetical protein